MSTIPVVVGGIMAAAGAASGNRFCCDFDTSPTDTSTQDATLYAGYAVLGAGAVWMITSGIVLGVRKRQLRKVKETSSNQTGSP